MLFRLSLVVLAGLALISAGCSGDDGPKKGGPTTKVVEQDSSRPA